MIKKRLYVKSFPSNQLGRFEAFGSVEAVSNHADFSFLTLETTPEQLKRLISTYHHSKWNGHVVQIQEAKKPMHEQVIKEAKKDHSKNSSSKRRLKKKAVQVDMTLPAASKHWSLVNGRLCPVIKIRKPSNSRVAKIDPLRFKSNYIRFDDSIDSCSNVLPTDFAADIPPDRLEKQRRRCAIYSPDELALCKALYAQSKQNLADMATAIAQSGMGRKKFMKIHEMQVEMAQEKAKLLEIASSLVSKNKHLVQERNTLSANVVEFSDVDDNVNLFDSDIESIGEVRAVSPTEKDKMMLLFDSD